MSAGPVLEKNKIRQSFSAACASYDAVAELQRTVGRNLLSRIETDRLAGTVLDIGCGTGFLTAELLSWPGAKQMLALDLALPMLQITRGKLADAGNVRYLCADAEALPVADHAVDHVFSNLALQWCEDLETVFNGIRRILKPGCQLIFSTFGPRTLRELKSAWAEVDDYSHVNEFYSQEQHGCFLERAGFHRIRTESQLHTPTYDSVQDLMKELKHIGAHNVTAGRNRRITTKTQMQGMITAYEAFRAGGRIPASFEVIMITAQA
jgi:malonyl-CoA O-methyltransferase